MKKAVIINFFLIWFFQTAVASEKIKISFKSKIGDKISEYNLDETKTKPDQLQFFLKKSKNILKLKSHKQKFCENEKFELILVEGTVEKRTLACVRSKTKITQEMKSLANLLQVQYADPL